MSASVNYNRLIALLLLVSGVGLIIWSAWGLAERHYPHLLGRIGHQEAIEVKSAQTKSKPSQYDVNKIVAAHLFGKPQQKVAQKTEKAPETKLKLKLLGVMASGDEHYARAMIQVDSKGMKTYAIGDSIDGTDALLHMVENEKVILDRKGNLESLAMGLPRTKIKRNKPGTS